MTAFTNIALWVVGIGLTVAALAGVPLLAENDVAAPWFWFGGLCICVIGLLLLATAGRGQRAANSRVRLSRDIDVQQLKIERRALVLRQSHNRSKRVQVRGLGFTTAAQMREGIDLLVDGAAINALLERNANEFRRLGLEPSE